MTVTASAYTLAELADLFALDKQGDDDTLVSGVAAIAEAKADDLSYVRDGQYSKYLASAEAGILLLTPALAADYAGSCLITADPYLYYAKITALFHPLPKSKAGSKAGIAASAVISASAQVSATADIGEQVVIGAGCVIGDEVVVGAGCIISDECTVKAGTYLHPNVTIAAQTEIGERCIIHSGAVLGADGFGFAPEGKAWCKIPQIGNVILGDDVEIGANTTIDRAAMGSTRIGNGVKLDNLIQVGHNTQIGDHTAVAACTAIAGSTKIGRYCRIAGMCAIAGHLEIADDVTVTGTGLVTHSLKKPGVYSSGVAVDDNARWRKNSVRFRQLDKMARRLSDVEKQLAELKKESPGHGANER